MHPARKFLLWSAQILGSLLFLLVIAFSLGNGLSMIHGVSEQDLILLTALAMMLTAVIFGFFRTLPAAILLLLASSVFIVMDGQASPHPLIILFLIDGILFLSASFCYRPS